MSDKWVEVDSLTFTTSKFIIRNMIRKSNVTSEASKLLPESLQVQKSLSNWRDHPVVIAAVTCAATLGGCILVFKEIVMPTQIAAISNETRELPVLRAEKDLASSKIKALEATVIAKDKEIEKIKSDLLDVTLPRVFSASNPYPIDQRQVKLGDPASKLKEAYPISALDTTMDDWWSVKTKDGLFSSAAYYLDDNVTNRTITGILFFANKKLTGEILLSRLTEEFGKPKEKVLTVNSVVISEYVWSVGKGFKSKLTLSKDQTPLYYINRN